MKFCWVTLPVEDLDKSLDFYNGLLNIPVSSKIINEHVKLVMLGEDNEPKIELLEVKDQEKTSVMTVGLEVDNMDDTIEFLNKNNIEIVSGPVSPNPSVKFVFINDPDGYEVQLVENL